MNPDDFNPSEIEQMEVEFKPCTNCEDGQVSNGLWSYTCPICHGTMEIPVRREIDANL